MTTLTRPEALAGSTAAASPSLPYQPALDGLRGLAVAAVVLYHGRLARGGFLGVDVFFALSGYLITSLLLAEHARTGRVATKAFWIRRARRLLPAVLVLLVLVALYARLVARSDQYEGIRSGALATLFYVQNYWQINGHLLQAPGLGHTWSLSVEEQYYLVWPVILAALLWVTRRRPTLLLVAIVLLAMGSAGLMWRWYAPGSGRAIFSTEARAQELLIGAALALVLRGWDGPRRALGRNALEMAGIAAFATLLVMVVTVRGNAAWLFHGGHTLVALCTVAVIAAATAPSSRLLRPLLSLRVLVALGLISYGLYLFHIPVLGYFSTERFGSDESLLFVPAVAVAVAIAIGSYHFVERPVRTGAVSGVRLWIVAPTAIAVSVGALLVATSGATPAPPIPLVAEGYRARADAAPRDTPRVLVVGDPVVAASMSTALGGTFAGAGIAGTTASGFCGVALPRPRCTGTVNQYQTALIGYSPRVAALMPGTMDLFDVTVGGKVLPVGSRRLAAHLAARLELTVALIRDLAPRESRVLLLTVPCMSPTTPGPSRAILGDFGRTTWLNRVIRRFAATHRRSVVLADYAAFLCPDGQPRTEVPGGPTRQPDGLNLTRAGALATWRWLAPIASAEARSGGSA